MSSGQRQTLQLTAEWSADIFEIKKIPQGEKYSKISQKVPRKNLYFFVTILMFFLFRENNSLKQHFNRFNRTLVEELN